MRSCFLFSSNQRFELLKFLSIFHRLECQLFGIDPPKLNSYANIERDMEITSSLLNTLLEFQNELKKFEEEPWITFRLIIF